jgi:hypothetical protein
MKHAVLLFAMAVIALTAQAQPQAPALMWRQFLSDETDYQSASVRQLSDGGFIITGARTQFNGGDVLEDAYLWKVDSLGVTEWFKTIGATDKLEQPDAVCLSADGGYVLAGSQPDETHQSDDQADVVVISADASGDSLWQHRYNLGFADEIHSVEPAGDGGYILAGSSDLGEDQVTNMSLFKISAEGDSLWTRFFTSGMMAQGSSAKPTPDGGYILVGTNRIGSAYIGHAFVVKTDAQGQMQWQRVYGRTNEQMLIQDVVVTPDGGYALTGCAFISQARNNDAFVLRLSAAGDSLWMHYYGLNGRCADHPGTIALMPDGGFVLGGSAELLDNNNATIYQMYEMIGVSSTGDQQWLLTADSSQSGTSQSLCITRDLGYVMSGVDWNVADGRLHVNRFFASPIPPNSADPASLPKAREIALYPNYPNPFNPSTEISFDLPQAQPVRLAIFDELGREVAVLADGVIPQGRNMKTFDASRLASGVYFYQLRTTGTMQVRSRF